MVSLIVEDMNIFIMNLYWLLLLDELFLLTVTYENRIECDYFMIYCYPFGI